MLNIVRKKKKKSPQKIFIKKEFQEGEVLQWKGTVKEEYSSGSAGKKEGYSPVVGVHHCKREDYFTSSECQQE